MGGYPRKLPLMVLDVLICTYIVGGSEQETTEVGDVEPPLVFPPLTLSPLPTRA